MILELGQSLLQFDWIRVTAEYSNVVLIAVLPYVSNTVEKLNLPVPRPVTLERVLDCNIAPRRKLEVGIRIKGDWDFLFSNGYIGVVQSRHSYFILQKPEQIPEFFGTVRISKAQAVQMARDCILKLGIRLETVFAEQEPHVIEPEKIGTNVVPHYRIRWSGPTGGPSVDIEINGDKKCVERIVLMNKALERAPPQINVAPLPAASRFSEQWQTNPEYAQRLIPIVFRAIDDYGKKLALPVPRPLTTNQVARFSLANNGGWPHAEIELTNGWRFIYRNSMVNGYYAPDNLFNSDNRPILIKEFTGKWNFTEKYAIELVRRAMAKLNYPSNLVHMGFAPKVVKPALPGIPRYSLWWNLENAAKDDLQSKVEAEVDADKGELKSLYYDDKAYWNKPPPIDVPISVPAPKQTNAAPISRNIKPVEKAPRRN